MKMFVHFQTRLMIVSSVLIISAAISSCGRGARCTGDDQQLGAISSLPAIACLPSSDRTEFVIESDSSYKALFPGCSLPAIDFSTESLLGLYTETTGCDNKTRREVRILSENNEYHYAVTVTECGLCKPLIMSYHWVTVPKLPEGWGVKFEKTIR